MTSAAALARLAALGRQDDDPGAAFARVAWSMLTEPGDGIAGVLVERLGPERSLRLILDAMDAPGGARRVADACREALSISGGDHARLVDDLARAFARWRPRAGTATVEHAVDAAIAVGAQLIIPEDGDWPAGLADLGPHAPLALWLRAAPGRAALSAPALGIVGSRAASRYGTDITAEIASAAVDAGVAVLSGGAYGVDATAHRVALAAGGATVAVLAGGIDQLYPSGNIELLHHVMRSGAVVAESAPGVRPSRWRFLQRNRLIAAMAGAVVVTEAGVRSGALNTANHAAQLGRPVGAVPGPLMASTSAGCHRLVAAGRATLLTSIRDAVDLVVGVDGGQPVVRAASDDPLLLRVLDALGRRRGISVQEIARRAGMGITEVTDTLALAELEARVERTPSGWRLLA